MNCLSGKRNEGISSGISPLLKLLNSFEISFEVRSFCDWAMAYFSTSVSELSLDQKKIKKGLEKISLFTLKEISSILVKSSKRDVNQYHKDSLTEVQRNRILKIAKSSKDKAILSLMSINGLGSIEVCRLQLDDCRFNEKRLSVQRKARLEMKLNF